MQSSSETPHGMLVLTREPGEFLRIGDEITITVLTVRDDEVRFGICAPSSVAVHREEIYQRIQAEKCSGAVASSTQPQVIIRRKRLLRRE